jgi:hypothetical protein
MAPRSRQVVLSCPSSLPGHSDLPTPITPLLPVSSDLIDAYRRRSPAETLGSQALPPLSLTACRWPYPGSLPGACALSSLAALAFSLIIEDRRVSPHGGVYPSIGLSQLYPSDHILRGCTIRIMLRPAALAGTPDWVRPAICEPSRYRVGASSARVLPHAWDRNAARTVYRQRVSDTHSFDMCGGFLVPP